MNNAIIELTAVEKSYNAKRVLTGADLSIPRGAVMGLLGTNGAGKTTLLKTLLGLIRRDRGQSTILGEDSWNLSAATKMRLGYVPQTPALYPWLKARSVIEYISSFYPAWNDELVRKLIADWDIPMNDRVGILSVGQQQKLAILLALGHEPDILILDEPAASLDPLARRQF